MPQLSLHSPVGDLTLSEVDGAIVALDWGWGRDQQETALLSQARAQLYAYFDEDLQVFDLPLDAVGTEHQKKVYAAMYAIPYGETLTYGAIADDIGSIARAVGTACGSNPIPVIIPCHRVLAGNSLGGYSGDGGLETKTALLRLEGALPPTLF
jgi:methylated-DNA-[protein]-cysteine S-methyltransferase